MPSYIESSNEVVQSIYMLLTGKHFGPFWFIPMITLFYFLSIPILYLDRQPRFYYFIFPLLFLGGLFLFRFGHNSSIWESFVYFLPVYFLGMWASRYHTFLISHYRVLVILLGAFYLIIFCLEVVDIIPSSKFYSFGQASEQNVYLFNFGKAKAAVLCILLLLILYHLQTRSSYLWRTLAVYSFGIYFIHLYLMRALEWLIGLTNINILFNSFVYLAYLSVVTFLCIICIRIIKLITKQYSRYIIGC